jgi:hypothetical protein
VVQNAGDIPAPNGGTAVGVRKKSLAFLAAALFGAGSAANAALIPVAPGASVQAAIDVAFDGDTIALTSGVYPGDIDFLGKEIIVFGIKTIWTK